MGDEGGSEILQGGRGETAEDVAARSGFERRLIRWSSPERGEKRCSLEQAVKEDVERY